MSRQLSFLFAAVALVLLGVVAWQFVRLEKNAGLLGQDHLVLIPGSYADLPGWDRDRLTAALPALRRSCARLMALSPARKLGGEGAASAGTVADWQAVCAAAAAIRPGDEAAARSFFESELRPVAVRNGRKAMGLFTGYYEALLHGSRKRHDRFQVPIYRRPPELVMVDLGKFRPELSGQRIAGHVEEGNLLPYPDRAAIDEGALAGRGLEIAWVDDPVDAFFLHIQGSGRIQLAEGGELRVGYSGQNGHPYLAIGRELVSRGALDMEEVSMQSIRQWLTDHPDQAASVMRKNASYVFFQELAGDGPLGAEGVALTPGRSLAVDRRFIPLGVPVYLDARMPGLKEGDPDRALRRVLVAQDTGGAIRGPVRGDVFWGYGEEAADLAGRMKHPGTLWLLLPKAVVERLDRPERGVSGPTDPGAPLRRPPGPGSPSAPSPG
jgi:membrane-bound lytic murein transglycosylase A